MLRFLRSKLRFGNGMIGVLGSIALSIVRGVTNQCALMATKLVLYFYPFASWQGLRTVEPMFREPTQVCRRISCFVYQWRIARMVAHHRRGYCERRRAR